MKLATWHWHIEISSKCTLRCPRCPRAEVPDTLVNTELRLEFFQRNFTPQFISEHVEKITFCGDDGDPIYAHDLIDVIKYFKSVKPIKFVIITNGSYKKADWWSRLGEVLDHNDEIHFSLDGWDQSSNEQYRVNSSWDSIMLGIQTLRQVSDVYMIWAAIAFKFNEDRLDSMQEQAEQLGFDRFQVTRSTKFNKIYPVYPVGDPLQPRDQMISSTHRYERDIKNLTDRTLSTQGSGTNRMLYNQLRDYGGVKPLCSVGNKGLYINSLGRFFPCCWVANRYNHNSEWIELAKNFDLNEKTLTSVITDDFWSSGFEIFPWEECRNKCNASVIDSDYASEW